MAPTLLELAEDTAAHFPQRPGSRPPVVTDRFWFLPGPRVGRVQRIRLDVDDVEPALAEIRRHAGDHEQVRVTWWIGDLATPHDLPDRLIHLGLVRDPDVPAITSMAIRERPSREPTVDVRRIETADDFVLAQDIDLVCAGTSEADRARWRDLNRAAWPAFEAAGVLTYLAYVDGSPVGYARADPGETAVAPVGGGVIEAARGRGAYTSLVHARWRDADDRGTPILVTQANEISRPILEHLGFETLGTIQLLVDDLSHSK